ncbi:MAG: structural protein P5 [Dysgonamonadaceae bacterium]|jgi:hypothetical protein|nr:structural protein P5 [Dysgonamonadaceae bacterium]
MATPRGLRNNNPLNIRHSRDVFHGEICPGTDKSFKQFESAAYGYRAAFLTLGTYLKRGWNTLEKIISHWAPPTENNTEGYIKKVANGSHVPRNKVLTDTDGEDFIAIAMAMTLVENGIPGKIQDVRAGFALQNRIKLK